MIIGATVLGGCGEKEIAEPKVNQTENLEEKDTTGNTGDTKPATEEQADIENTDKDQENSDNAVTANADSIEADYTGLSADEIDDIKAKRDEVFCYYIEATRGEILGLTADRLIGLGGVDGWIDENNALSEKARNSLNSYTVNSQYQAYVENPVSTIPEGCEELFAQIKDNLGYK